VKAVCFDNDGLLLDTEAAWTRAEVVLFARFGREFTDEHKRSMIGSSGMVQERKLEELLDRPGEGPELAREMHALALEELRRGVEPMPGAFALVDGLRAAGTPVALVSNSPRAFVELATTTAGVGERFDAVLAREDVEHGKPAPDLYLKACAMLGAWAGHVVMARQTGAARGERRHRQREVPLAVIMVALTTLTLWSLGQALVVEAPANASATAAAVVARATP
jgi:HAD superfamily hydrolase (TIGR01509 family)